MVRINLSTRPFYNERLVTALIAVVGVVALGVAAFSVQQIVSLSSKRTTLRAQIAQGEAAANRDNIETAAIQKSINARALKGLAGRGTPGLTQDNRGPGLYARRQSASRKAKERLHVSG